MGCYISLDNTSNIKDVVAAIIRRPQGAELLVADEFNADLADPEGTMRTEEITVSLADSGLEDMSAH